MSVLPREFACSRCGSNLWSLNLNDAKILLTYNSEKRDIEMNGLIVNPYVCMNCGHVELNVTDETLHEFKRQLTEALAIPGSQNLQKD